MNTRRELTDYALQVGGVLNLIEDDDERELLQEHFEQVLNAELFAGSQNRRLAHALTPILAPVPVDEYAPADLRVPSVGSDPRDGYKLSDPKRLAFESRDW